MEIPSTITRELDSIPAIHVGTHGEVMSPTRPIDHLNKPSDPTLSNPAIFKSGPVDGCADEATINAIPPAPSLIHFVFAIFSISLTLLIFFFIVAWVTVLRETRLMNNQVLSDANGVSILGHGLQIDIDACVLSISWMVLVCGIGATSGVAFLDDVRVPVNCKPFDKALDVYINNPSSPFFSFIPYSEIINQSVWDPPRFTMEHQFNRHGKWDPNEDFMNPFEYYSFHAVAFAIDPATNSSVNVSVFGVLDILGDFVIHSHDAADTSVFTYKSGDGLVSMEVQSRVLRAEIKRSVISKAFAICLFLGNWAMTIGSVYTTALVASDRLEANSVIAALPFSALLAIPAIRSLYASSLGVSIDAVALFVQTATIGLCCLVLLRVLTRCRSSCTTGYPV